jgi:hypothetical protein
MRYGGRMNYLKRFHNGTRVRGLQFESGTASLLRQGYKGHATRATQGKKGRKNHAKLRNEPELVGPDFLHNILKINVLRLRDRKHDSGSFSRKWLVTKSAVNAVPHPLTNRRQGTPPVVERSVDRGGGFVRLRTLSFSPFSWRSISALGRDKTLERISCTWLSKN